MQDVIKAADQVIAAVDQTALARHLARKTPEEGPGAKERKKQAEEQKAALIDALEKKASVLLEMHPDASADQARLTRTYLNGPCKDADEWKCINGTPREWSPGKSAKHLSFKPYRSLFTLQRQARA